MRIATLLAEAPRFDTDSLGVPNNGRLAFIDLVMDSLPNHHDVEEMVVFDPLARSTPKPRWPGVCAIEPAKAKAWAKGKGDVVLLEPARQYWHKPAFLRRLMGIDAPIISLLHGTQPFQQVEMLIASLAVGREPHDLVLAPSQSCAHVFLRQCEEVAVLLAGHVDMPVVQVVPYGVPAPAHVDRTRSRQYWRVESEKTSLIVYLGLLSPEKADLGALLVALRGLSDEGLPFQAVLAGISPSDKWTRHLQGRLAAAGLNHHVRIAANISSHEKNMLLAAADIFTSPSRTVSESFGLAVIEAMMHSVPVVCSEWDGYREIVRDGVDGYLISTDWDDALGRDLDLDALLGSGRHAEIFRSAAKGHAARVDAAALQNRLGHLIRDEDLRAGLGMAAGHRARSLFTIDRFVDDFIEVAKRLLPVESRLTSTPLDAPIYSVYKSYVGAVQGD